MWLSGKESACWAGDAGSIPGSGRSSGGGNGSPLLYSCLENSMVRGAWRAAVQGLTVGHDLVTEQYCHFTSVIQQNSIPKEPRCIPKFGC